MPQHIVLFHSVLGLRPAVLRFADRLRAEGHTVHTPDLFDGATFDDYAPGEQKRDALGIPELIRRAHAAVAGLPQSLVYAGFSMGTAPAELLAATRPGARGAILMHGGLAPAVAGIEAWPQSVAVQIHNAEHDPWLEPEGVEALAGAARAAGAPVEVFFYPGDGHLFADEDLKNEYHPASARLMFERVRDFLARLP